MDREALSRPDGLPPVAPGERTPAVLPERFVGLPEVIAAVVVGVVVVVWYYLQSLLDISV
jgi:hypothetical protein